MRSIPASYTLIYRGGSLPRMFRLWNSDAELLEELAKPGRQVELTPRLKYTALGMRKRGLIAVGSCGANARLVMGEMLAITDLGRAVWQELEAKFGPPSRHVQDQANGRAVPRPKAKHGELLQPTRAAP